MGATGDPTSAWAVVLPGSIGWLLTYAIHNTLLLGMAWLCTGKALILRAADGGKTWEQEDAPVPTGTLYLTHDGETLTVIDRSSRLIVVLRHKDG